MAATVTVTRHETALVIRYAEAPDRVHDFDAEIGMGKVLIYVYAPRPDAWDARLPWAAGRRDEVLERVGREVARREGWRWGRRFRIHEGGVEIFA